MTDLTQYEMASYHVHAVEVKGEVVWYEPNKRFQWRKIPFSKARKLLARYGLTPEEFLNEKQLWEALQ